MADVLSCLLLFVLELNLRLIAPSSANQVNLNFRPNNLFRDSERQVENSNIKFTASLGAPGASKLEALDYIKDNIAAENKNFEDFKAPTRLKITDKSDQKQTSKILDAEKLSTSVGKNSGFHDVPFISDQLSSIEERSLLVFLLGLINRGPAMCRLVLVADERYRRSELLSSLAELPRPKVVVSAEHALNILPEVRAVPSPCRLHVYLTDTPGPLLALLNGTDQSWDFAAWHIGVGWTLSQFRSFTKSAKLRRTPRAANIMRSGNPSSPWTVVRHCVFGRTDCVEYVGRKQLEEDVASYMNIPYSTNSPAVLNLNNYKLKVVIFEWKPSVFFESDGSGRQKPGFGIDVEVVRALAMALNFSIVYQEPAPGEFWGTLKNGVWTGMVGLVNRTEADLGIGNLFLTLFRHDAVQYSAPYDAEVSCFMASIGAPLAPWQRLTFPFSRVTWVAVGLGCLALWGSLTLFLNTSFSQEKHLSVVQTSLVTFGVILREQVKWTPVQHASRLLLSVTWLYGIVITVAYSSNLTALLMVTKSPPSYETVKQLYEAGLPVASLGDFFEGALASAVDPYLKGLADRFVAYDSLESIWPLVERGESVYLHNRQFLEYTIATQFTAPSGVPSLRIMKQCFAPYSIAMALQKHSPLKTSVDTVIARLIESGLVRHWFLQSLKRAEGKQVGIQEKKSTANKPPVEEEHREESTGFVALSLDHLSGAFLLYCILNLSSLVAFCAELNARRRFPAQQCCARARLTK